MATSPVSAGPSNRCKSKYPPGIEAIMGPKGKNVRRDTRRCDSISSTGTLDAHSRFGYMRPDTPDPADISRFYHEVEKTPSLMSPRPERSTNRFIDGDILDEDIVVSSRATAIRLVQTVQQNLGRICDGMDLTMRECFPRKRDLFEVPSYKRLRLSLLRFIETLTHLKDLLAEPIYFEDDTAIKVAFYVLKSPLDSIVGECFCILKVWDRRGVGHGERVRLEDRIQRLWAHVIQDDDKRLENLRNQIILVDATVLSELKQRCPNIAIKPKSGRVWRWLEYLEPVCPGFGECDHDQHQLRLVFVIHKYRDTKTENSKCVIRVNRMSNRHSTLPRFRSESPGTGFAVDRHVSAGNLLEKMTNLVHSF